MLAAKDLLCKRDRVFRGMCSRFTGQRIQYLFAIQRESLAEIVARVLEMQPLGGNLKEGRVPSSGGLEEDRLVKSRPPESNNQSAKMFRGARMRKLGVGVLGVGDMGKCHAENILRSVPEARLVAVADPAENRVKAVATELEVEHTFTRLEDMLEHKDIDCVVIAAPDKFHARAICAAALAGKHILCEKPLAINLEDAHDALDAVARAGVHLQVGFMRRYDPGYSAAKQRIEAGEIGDPVLFKSIGRDRDAPPIAAYQSRLNGMLLYNNTIHDFDLSRWLMQDEVSEVQTYATVAIRPEIAQYGDVVASVVNLKYQRGAIGNVESFVQANYGYDVRTEIVGSKGSILVGSLQQTPVTFLTRDGGTQILQDHFLARFASAYVAEVKDFIQNMLNDRPPRVSGEDGLRALEIAVAAERSHLQSKPCGIAKDAR
jgi:scyllo-inositol 2-dehydrogenase (NAD+)